MANKKNKIKDVKTEELNNLVNESKNIDVVKVSEVIAENTEKTTKEEGVIETVEDVTEVITDEIETVNETEVPNEESSKEIRETEETVSVEPKEESKPKKAEKEPWYVSRAKRVIDYYNW